MALINCTGIVNVVHQNFFFFRPAFDAYCRVSVLGKKRKEKDRNNKKTHNMGITHVGGYDWTGSKLN